MNIGTLFRRIRESRDLTTRETAQAIGVSLSTYIDWEHDKTAPSLRIFPKIASAFDISPVEFMSYLTGQVPRAVFNDEVNSIKELNEMVKHLRNHNNLLVQVNESVTNELEKFKNDIRNLE